MTLRLKAVAAFGFSMLCITPALAGSHPCAGDAIEQAKKLLRFHVGPDLAGQQIGDGDTVKVLPPVRALAGKGRFDVLEVTSGIYKTDYRMRFIYAQISGSCLLMGEEILEASNPY